MDSIARTGRIGRVLTVPAGLPPGSDVANLSLLGYDAAANFEGRGPIEAASIGVELDAADTAFRCNVVTLRDGLMDDYSAGHIGSEDSRPMIEEIQAALGTETVKFVPGISYRHLTIIRDFPRGLGLHAAARHQRPALGAASAEGARAGDHPRPHGESPADARRQRGEQAAHRGGKEAGHRHLALGPGPGHEAPHLASALRTDGIGHLGRGLVRGLGVLAGLKVRLVPGRDGLPGDELRRQSGRGPGSPD